MTTAFSKQTATQSAFLTITLICSPMAFSDYTDFIIFPAHCLFLNYPIHSQSLPTQFWIVDNFLFQQGLVCQLQKTTEINACFPFKPFLRRIDLLFPPVSVRASLEEQLINKACIHITSYSGSSIMKDHHIHTCVQNISGPQSYVSLWPLGSVR